MERNIYNDKGSICQEDIAFLNVYATKTDRPKIRNR